MSTRQIITEALVVLQDDLPCNRYTSLLSKGWLKKEPFVVLKYLEVE